MGFSDDSETLAHYGVKGMRWGHRKAEEDGGDRSSSKKEEGSTLRSRISESQTRRRDKAASTYDAAVARSNVEVKQLEKAVSTLPPGAKLRSTKSELRDAAAYRDYNLDQAKKIREARLTPMQKKLLIGAVVVGGVAAVAYTKSRYDMEGVHGFMREQRSMAEFGSPFKINKDLAKKGMSPEEIIKTISKDINPNYASSGGKMNCRRCTMAYELRRRGYDVNATTSALGYGQSESGLRNALTPGQRNLLNHRSLSAMWHTTGDIATPAARGDRRSIPGASKTTITDILKLKDTLASHGDGARGEVVFGMNGFGHSMAYENIKGVPHIFDNQKGVHYPVTEKGMAALTSKWGDPKSMSITRLDNLDLDTSFLQRWATNNVPKAPTAPRDRLDRDTRALFTRIGRERGKSRSEIDTMLDRLARNMGKG